MPQCRHPPVRCEVRCLRLKPRDCDGSIGVPRYFEGPRKHAARQDRAFDGGALSAGHPAKHRHDFADVRLSRARCRDNRTRRLFGERQAFPPGRHGLPCPCRDRPLSALGGLRGLAPRHWPAPRPAYDQGTPGLHGFWLCLPTISCFSAASRPVCRPKSMPPPMRSLNVAVAAAMVAGEATRQLGGSFRRSILK
jgi:hypothetical protein